MMAFPSTEGGSDRGGSRKRSAKLKGAADTLVVIDHANNTLQTNMRDLTRTRLGDSIRQPRHVGSKERWFEVGGAPGTHVGLNVLAS